VHIGAYDQYQSFLIKIKNNNTYSNMSDDFVTFNIRWEKALFQLKIKTPGNVSGFMEKLVIK